MQAERVSVGSQAGPERRCLAPVLAAVALVGLLAAGAPADPAPLKGFEEHPGVWFRIFEDREGSIVNYATHAAVTGDTAMKVVVPEGPEPVGFILYELHGEWNGTKALSLWLKGDGSDGFGEVSVGYNRNGPKAYFPLAETNWHHLIIPWADFQPALDPEPIATVNFSLKEGTPRPASYVVDAIAATDTLEESAEDIRIKASLDQLQPKPDPGFPNPADYVTRPEALKRTLAKLQAKEPVTIVALGDSITAGAQLWNLTPKERQTEAIYHQLLGAMLREKFDYDGVTVHNAGVGGNQSFEGLERLEKDVLAHTPDLVVVLFGGNDANSGSLPRFKESMEQIVSQLEEADAEVVLLTTLPMALETGKAEPFADAVKELADKHKTALADTRAAMLFRGQGAIGELLADTVHINQRGHDLLASTLFALFNQSE